MKQKNSHKIRKEKVFLIFKKEIKEMLKSKEILATIIIMPVMFSVLIPASMVTMNFAEDEATGELGSLSFIFRNLAPYWDELNDLQKVTLLQAEMYLAFLIMIPLIVPMAISGDSIAGEKERKTIESLLAAPISETELFLGKTLAASAPSIVISWIAEIIYIIFTDAIIYNVMGGRIVLPDIFAGIMFFLLMPTQTILSTLIMTTISSKSKGSREAMQKSGLLSTPLIIFVSGIIFVPLLIHPLLCLVSEVILILLIILIMRVAVRGFNREKLISSGS